jgi:hypothetical protein
VIPNRVDGIGEPLRIFFFLIYLAIPVNAGIVVYTFNAFNFVSSENRVWVFCGLVVCGYFVLNRLDIIYPDMPAKTAIQIQRQSFIYNRVIQEQPPGDVEHAHSASAVSPVGF